MDNRRLGNLGDVGLELNLSNRQVGQYLIDMGYREKNEDGIKATNKAYKDKLAVDQTEKYSGGKEYHTTKWDIDKTVDAINSYLKREPVKRVEPIDKKTLSDMVIVLDGITAQSQTLPTTSFGYATFPFKQFNPVQTAVLPYIEQDVNLVICSATASGKTSVIEMCISYELIEHGKAGLFVGPLKALTSEKYNDWTDPKHCFSMFNISQCSGDYQITQQRIKELDNADVISITPEMLSSRCRNIEAEKSHFLQNAGVACYDEAHLLTCYSRGDGVETSMIQLAEINPDVRYVLLSGTMSNGEEIAEWVSGLNGKRTVLVKSDYRPIEIQENFVTYNAKGYYDKTTGKYKPASYKHTEAQKTKIALDEYLKHPDDKHLIFFHTKQSQRDALKVFQEAGVDCQIFNADVDRDIRNGLIEEFNRKDGLNCLLTSSSLAWGINLAARFVVIVGTTRGMEEVEVYDLLQEKGRAGRPKYDTEGHCTFIVSDKDIDDLQDRLSSGTIIESTFAVVRKPNTDKEDNARKVENTIAFHAIAEIDKGNNTKEKLEGWFKKTLAYHQQGDRAMKRIDNVISTMIKAGLIIETKGEYQITWLGRVAAMLYCDPFSIVGYYRNMTEIAKNNLSLVTDGDYAYILANIHEHADKYIAKGEWEKFDDDITLANKYELIHTNISKPFYVYYKILQGQTDNHFGAYQYQLAQDTERICLALKMIDSHYHLGFGKEIDILNIRLKYQVQRHLASLCLVAGIGGKRANRLYDNGIRTYEDLIEATPEQLKDSIGLVTPEVINEIKESARRLNDQT
jgi:replicative superfamily II helicase